MKKGYVVVFDYEMDYEYCASEDEDKIKQYFRSKVEKKMKKEKVDTDWDNRTLDECVAKGCARFDNHYISIQECIML